MYDNVLYILQHTTSQTQTLSTSVHYRDGMLVSGSTFQSDMCGQASVSRNTCHSTHALGWWSFC